MVDDAVDQLHTPAAGFAGAGVATLPRAHTLLPFLATIAEGIVLPMTVALASESSSTTI
jgi:hypothetical protein